MPRLALEVTLHSSSHHLILGRFHHLFALLRVQVPTTSRMHVHAAVGGGTHIVALALAAQLQQVKRAPVSLRYACNIWAGAALLSQAIAATAAACADTQSSMLATAVDN